MSLGTSIPLSKKAVKPCNICGASIAFKKTAGGQWYPVNISVIDGEPVMYQGPHGYTARHTCRTRAT